MKQLLRSMMACPGGCSCGFDPVRHEHGLLAFLDQVGRYTALAAFGIVCLFNMPMMWIQRGMTRLLAIPHFMVPARGLSVWPGWGS